MDHIRFLCTCIYDLVSRYSVLLLQEFRIFKSVHLHSGPRTCPFRFIPVRKLHYGSIPVLYCPEIVEIPVHPGLFLSIHDHSGISMHSQKHSRWGAWKYRNGPERTGMDTGTDPNGQWNGPEWTAEWTGMDRNGPEWTQERTGMDTGTDWNGPEDTMKSLALHPLFDIRIEKSLNVKREEVGK